MLYGKFIKLTIINIHLYHLLYLFIIVMKEMYYSSLIYIIFIFHLINIPFYLIWYYNM